MQFEISINQSIHVKKFAEFLCHELDILPKKLTIASHEAEDGNSGLCIDESEDEFIILVKETNRNIGEIFTTIAHEMIHVKQHMKESLGYWLDMHSDIPYMERWWEKEAFSNSIPLVEKFIKTLKK
jgi:hypothetical protein